MDLTASPFPVGPWCESPRCNEPVVWATTGRARMLVNAATHPDGNIVLRDNGGSDPHAQVLTVAQRATKAAGTLHLSHFATCPDARRYRRART